MNFDQAGFLGELSRLAPLLPTSYTIEQTLQELTHAVSRRLSLLGAGMSLAENGTLRCISAVSTSIRELEDAQNDSRTGPGFHAFQIGEPVLVPRLDEEPFAWPVYRPHAERLGIKAIAGLPVVVGGTSIGVMDLYSAEPHDWRIPEVESLVRMADIVSAYLVNAKRAHEQDELNQQLQGALDSRVVIEQAKGMIAQAHQVSTGAAFDRIQRYARSRHSSVRAVADAVVNLGLQP